MVDWRPSASADTLVIRARLLQRIRAFFQAREVLEVDTPLLSRAAVTDPHLESFVLQEPQQGVPRYLHTSPEYAMKRLLAAGTVARFTRCAKCFARARPVDSTIRNSACWSGIVSALTITS